MTALKSPRTLVDTTEVQPAVGEIGSGRVGVGVVRTRGASASAVSRAEPCVLDAERTDAGFSLVEMVVTLALMGIALIPIMMASWTLVRSSGQNRTATRVSTVLSNAADRVNRAPESCDYSVYLQAASLAEGWGTDNVSAVYHYYVPGATAIANGSWETGACPGGVYEDGLVQKVDITVISPDGKLHRSVQVVKSQI